MAPVLLNLISQYPILETLANYVSTLDLYHLGIACRDMHTHILTPPQLFANLRRHCLCDGRGFQRRLNVSYYPSPWLNMIDREIEVRLFNLKCDEAGALPCRKCGINICEECREYPRIPPIWNFDRRPHLNELLENSNVICLCDSCDTKLEDEIHGEFLNELCDCDILKRWICKKCVKEEERWTKDYYEKYTSGDGQERFSKDYDKTKRMINNDFEISFYCMCGAFVPNHARPRCTWCKRKHRPEREWFMEMDEFDAILSEDGSYPVYDLYSENTSYPTLPYNGPIYQGPYENNET
ncbi:hypothetical protein F4806DRAFT_457350 [Annulohypoxylon nitens]|nr:hypothetical protein F4806DRAFT_457350 [Annulohypoxylon nitens]